MDLSEKQEITLVWLVLILSVCLIFLIGYSIGYSISQTDCYNVFMWMQHKRACGNYNWAKIADKSIDYMGINFMPNETKSFPIREGLT